MAGRIPREFIDDLLVRVDIVDLIDSHVPLKKTGSNYMARCPFHNEKTPSFSVNRKKQFYHCFGCGASGNAISFLMDYDHLDFVEAVEDLASFIGVDVPREQSSHLTTQPPKQDTSKLYEALDKVMLFYQQQLKSNEGKKAVDYLKSRGVSGEIAKKYALGYAPDKWDTLAHIVDAKQLLDTGMLIQHESGRLYDRFRGRLMFPIRDKRNRVIGFGGRVLDDSLPKYLNSPETAVFSKSNELYGLPEVLENSSRPERIIIVEGYMDVIALAQHGIDFAVATLGTATSKRHIEQLFRFTSELVLCFDGDKAGKQAAWRAMEALLPNLKDKRQAKIMQLPESHDPDSLVRAEGLDKMLARIQSATPLSEYFFATLTTPLNLDTVEGRSTLASEAKPYLETLPPGFFREMMFSQLEDLTKSTIAVDIAAKTPTLTTKAYRPRKLSPARVVIALLLQNPELVSILDEQNINWEETGFKGADLLRDIYQKIQSKAPVNTALLLEEFRESSQEKIVRNLAGLELNIPDQKAEFKDTLNHLLTLDSNRQLEQLLAKSSTEGLSPHEKQKLNILLKKIKQ